MNDNYGNIIFREEDNSYVIEKNGNPYHVPNEGEFAAELAAVDAFARANPEAVSIEAALELSASGE